MNIYAITYKVGETGSNTEYVKGEMLTEALANFIDDCVYDNPDIERQIVMIKEI